MLSVNELCGFGVYESPVIGSLTDTGILTADATTWTFTNQSIGEAESNRFVVVCIMARSGSTGRTISSVTIGGISATEIIRSNTTSENTAAIYGAFIPTGTTATVVVTFSGLMLRCALSTYRLVNLLSTTPVSTASSLVEPGVINMNTVPGGFGIGASIQQSATSPTASWTGLTEDFDADTGETGTSVSSASASFTTTETPRSINVDWNLTVGVIATAGCVFR